MKKRIPFGVWEPDSGSIGTGRAVKAVNVAPVRGGYRAIDGWDVAYNASGARFGTSPIGPTDVVAAFSFGNEETSFRRDFIGTTSDIYSITNSGATAAVVTGQAVTTAAFSSEYHIRDMTQYGQKVIATSGRRGSLGFTAPICEFSLASGVSFSAIPAGFQTDYVSVIRDFVVCGATWDSTDGDKSGRIRWSAFGDYTSWTPSAATQADIQDLPSEVGAVRRILGGNDAFIVCENGVYFMQYVGGAVIMRFDYIHKNIGTEHPYSCIRINDYVYMYSPGGFLRLGKAPGDVAAIGKGRVDEEFYRLLTTGNSTTPRVRVYHDEVNRCIGWQYHPTGGQAFVYFYDYDAWAVHGNSTDRAGAYFVYSSAVASGAGSALPTNYQIQRVPTAVGTNGVIYTQLSKTNKAKFEISTSFEELAPGKKAVVDKVWPVFESRGGSVTNPELVVTSIPKLSGVNLYAEPTSTYSSTASLQSDGFFTVTGPGSYEGKFHRFQLENSDTASERAGEQAILGIDVEFFERGNY